MERLRQSGLMLEEPAWAVQAVLLCCQPAGLQGFTRGQTQVASEPVQGARPEEVATPQLLPGAIPCQSLSPTAGRTHGTARLCKATSPKVRRQRIHSQGQALYLLGTCHTQGRPSTGTAICHVCRLGCHVAQCPTWARATSNPQSVQAQHSLHDTWAAWWYGGDPSLRAQLSWPMRGRRSPRVSGM